VKIVNAKLIAEVGGPGLCEHCLRPSLYREVHHALSIGSGGGGRIDHRLNLLGLCLRCHRELHDGNLSREILWEVIAKREGVSVEEVKVEVYRIRSLPKGSKWQQDN
jgi:hypothetical protein